MATLENPNPKLGFFRGADFCRSVGVSDWRIGLFFPEFGLKTWIFGKGELPPINKQGVTLERFNTIPLPILGTLYLFLLYARKAAKLELDVVICNMGIIMAGILLKMLRPRTKLILDVRSVPVEARGLVSIFWKLYFNTVLRMRFFDAISVITQGMLDDLDHQHHLKEKVPTIVWESGYDHEIFTPTLDNSKFREKLRGKDQLIVMFHGTLSPARGLHESIRAVHILQERGFHDILLVFIGNGSAKSDLSQLVTELKIERHVLFLPPVAHHEIPALIAAADLGIDPLPDHPWWRTQSALKVYEYLAMGKPVLGTDIPCHQNISKAVILTPDNEPITLANAIEQFRNLSRPEKTHLREIALHDSQSYSWRVRAEVVANFIKNEVLVR